MLVFDYYFGVFKWFSAILVLNKCFHILYMYLQAIDDDANQTGQYMASLLDWPQVNHLNPWVNSTNLFLKNTSKKKF